MIRMILGILAGLVAAVATVLAGETLGHSIFPPPADVDLSNPDAMRTLIEKLPTGAIVAVLAAWGAGAFVGGSIAARITSRAWTAWLIGAAMLLAGAVTMIEIPHPVWFMIASVPVALVPAIIAGRLFAAGRTS